jgi:mannose-1-phosphate guanylyltransferase
MQNDLFILILAGGSGERFWPLSRKATPKQLLNLFSDRTLLEETIHRLSGLVPVENILILTNTDQEASVREIITSLPPENIYAEPDKRDTAAAIALGVGLIAKRNPAATMVVLPADHIIRDAEALRHDLSIAADAARTTGALVTIGIPPTWACPGFGYIEQGPKLPGSTAAVFEVVRFREKPAPDLAESFLKQGNFKWNAGMFIWTVPSILAEFQRNTPELASFIQRLAEAADVPALLQAEFSALPKISIDYAILEKASRVLMVEASFDWDDVGGWLAVAGYLPRDGYDNHSNTPTTTTDSENNIIYSRGKKHIALLGVSDLVIVETADAILIANRHEAELIKTLIKKIPPELQ